MPEIITTGTPSPEDLKQSPLKDLWEGFHALDRGTKFILLSGVFLIIFGVYAANNILDTRQRAGGEGISRVDVQPGEITVRVNDINVGLSALAFDFSGNPIRDGVFYEWSMSSSSSAGTLTNTIGDLTELDPLTVGYADLTITARLGEKSVTKSVPVRITNPDGSIPPPPSPTVTPVVSPTITPSPNSSIQLTPKADSYVRSNQPSKNFGGSNVMWVDSSPKTIAFVKYDLSKLSGKSIYAAKLRFRVTNLANAQSKGDFLLKSVSSSWNEASIKYSNMPKPGSKIGSFGNVKKTQVIEIDLTSWVKANIGKNASFAIEALSTDDTSIRSSEATSVSNRPTLVIEYSDGVVVYDNFPTRSPSPTVTPTSTSTPTPPSN